MLLVLHDIVDFFALDEPHQVVRVDREVVVEADQLPVLLRYLHQLVGLLLVFRLASGLVLLAEYLFEALSGQPRVRRNMTVFW